ncbi:MAG TPA: ABC transporter permease [Methylomirabilota bacterium]|nr:ABC transporter permease [Methylomirabilota bacterium]
MTVERARAPLSRSSSPGTGARLRRQPGSLVGLIVLITLTALALAAPIVGRYDPLLQERQSRFQPPSLRHFFGTDEFGRDIWSRVVHGGRVSLFTGGAVVLVAGVVGIPLGLLGGYAGGWLDASIMRFLDFLLAVPAILLAMAIIAVLGPGAVHAVLAVAVVSIPAFARLTRASTLALKEREFVLAARAIGGGPAYLMFRTILPNAASPLLVQATVAAAYAILLEAALSFLGLSTRPPEPSWGSMLNTGRSFLYQAPWYGLFPGVMLTAAVLALNGLADGLQRALGASPLGRATARTGT